MMRMRKKPNLGPRMERCARFLIETPEARRGCWRELKPDAGAVWLELGCGKGRFTAEMAERNPEVLYLAVERVPDAMIAALEGDGFFEEARMGFPEAVLYEDDFQMSSPVGMESVLEEKLRGCVLVAEIGEEVRLYPHRLSADQREFFALELGEDVLEDALARDTDGSGVLLDL